LQLKRRVQNKKGKSKPVHNNIFCQTKHVLFKQITYLSEHQFSNFVMKLFKIVALSAFSLCFMFAALIQFSFSIKTLLLLDFANSFRRCCEGTAVESSAVRCFYMSNAFLSPNQQC